MGRFYSLDVRVYYEDTDSGGIVYYANYLKFAERGRTELLRAHGHDHRTLMRRHGFGFAVRRCSVEYLKPAMLDDMLRVETTVREAAGARIDMAQNILRGDELLVGITVRLALIDGAGRPVRLPLELKAALA